MPCGVLAIHGSVPGHRRREEARRRRERRQRAAHLVHRRLVSTVAAVDWQHGLDGKLEAAATANALSCFDFFIKEIHFWYLESYGVYGLLSVVRTCSTTRSTVHH